MVRGFLFQVIFYPLTLLIAGSAIISTLFDRTGALYHRHGRLWARIGLWLAGVRVEVTGQDKVPRHGPVVFMGNHQGNFDILTLFLAIPRQFSWLAKEELFRIPIFGHSMARAGYIPIDRGDGRQALRSLDSAAKIVKEGNSVVVFPEGTRSEGSDLLPFKRGGFLLAEKAQVPIVPFSINGSREINPPRTGRLKPGTIRLIFAEPLPTAGLSGRQRAELMERVRLVIKSGLEY